MSRAGARLAVAAIAVGVVAGVSACGTTTGGDAGSGADRSATVALAPATIATPAPSFAFGSPTYPSPAPIPAALPGGISADRDDPSSVAIAAARVWFGWNTTTDRSPYAAAVRTTPLMTAACARRITATPPVGSPDASWTALATSHARARVSAVIGSEERPPDTATTAVRLVAVTQTFTADRPVPARKVVAVVTMTRTDGVWKITDDGTGRCGVVIR